MKDLRYVKSYIYSLNFIYFSKRKKGQGPLRNCVLHLCNPQRLLLTCCLLFFLCLARLNLTHHCSCFCVRLLMRGAAETTNNIRTCEPKAGQSAPSALTGQRAHFISYYVGVEWGVLLMYGI